MSELPFKVCAWQDDKRWVYSITFDEALRELHRFSIPILEKYRVPGHLEVVVGQMGQMRQLLQSSYNGMHHMNADELREMLDRGWGVGNHSWSHTILTEANYDRELGEAKQVLEERIGRPVTIYCAPGDNINMSSSILSACQDYGYIGAMGLYEALNRPDDEDLMWIKRTYLHDNGPNTHDSEFDPFRKVSHAQRDQGWIIDYLHCPMEKVVHPRKDCSAAQLEERIATIVDEGGDEVWLAKVEDAVDYRYTRRHLQATSKGDGRFLLSAPGLPEGVQTRRLTLRLEERYRAAEINGKGQTFESRGGRQLLHVDLSKDVELRLIPEALEVTSG